MAPREPEWVVIGRVVKPHGIRGEVVVDVLSDVAGRFDPGVTVQVGADERTIAVSRPHQGRMLVGFDAICDRAEAEALRGLDVSAPAVDVSEAEMWFAHELVGMAVVDDAGHPLGAVAAVVELPTAADYDLLEVVRDDATTWLLPAVEAYVDVEVDADGSGRLRLVDAPEGLVPGPDAPESDEGQR